MIGEFIGYLLGGIIIVLFFGRILCALVDLFADNAFIEEEKDIILNKRYVPKSMMKKIQEESKE